MSLLVWIATASAQVTWTEYSSVLLTGADVPWGTTIGNPTVVYAATSTNPRYYMFFESLENSQTAANCPVGEWAIGMATSTDGLNWTVNNNPVVDGDPTDTVDPGFFSCVAAHPNAVFVPGTGGTGTIWLFFKAEQADDACDASVYDGDPGWGCNQYTGVGRLRVRLNADGTLNGSPTVSASPVISIQQDFGYPHALIYGGTAFMFYGQWPDVRVATASAINGTWTKRGVVVDPIDYNVGWMNNEFFNPAVSCFDSGVYPLQMYVGGREVSFGQVLFGGIGVAAGEAPVAPNLPLWTLGETPVFQFSGASGFRHWDILRVDETDFLMYYDEKDGSGNNEVKLQTTLATFTWNAADVHDKSCP